MFFEANQVFDLLSCQLCKNQLDTPFILPCGKIVCSKCAHCIIKQSKNDSIDCLCKSNHRLPDKEFPICEIILNLLATPTNDIYRGSLAEQLKTNLKEINKDLKQFKFELNNGGDRVKEHCLNLRNQVQLVTELAISQINQFNEDLINKIKEYENDLLVQIGKNKVSDQFDMILKEIDLFYEKYRSYLSLPVINDEETAKANDLANSFKIKLKSEKFKLEDFLFNGRLMKFSSNSIKLTQDILGSFQIHDTQATISYDTLKQLHFRNDLCNLNHSDSNAVHLDVFSDGTFFILYKKMNNDFKYFTLGKEKSREQYLYITNGVILNLKKNKNFIVLNYRYDCSSFIKIYDQNLQQICAENLTKKFRCNLKLVGVNDSYIFCIADDLNNHVYILTLQLDLIETIGVSFDSSAKFYIPFNIKQFDNVYGKFIWLSDDILQILDETTGDVLHAIEIHADKFEIDNFNNLIVFSNLSKKLFYFDLNGELLKEVTLNNFHGNESFSFFVNKFDNALYFFDKKTLTILN